MNGLPTWILLGVLAACDRGDTSDDTDTGSADDTDTADTDTGDSDTDTGSDTDTDSDSDTDTDTGDTGDTADTGDTGDTGGPVEDCSTPGDENGNTLADCEDPACLEYAACFEVDCTDGVDGDSDDFVDCNDEDCWGRGCAVTQASLLGADSVVYDHFSSTSSVHCSPFGPSYTSTLTSTSVVDARSVHGTVRTKTASAGNEWKTCQWEVGMALFFGGQLEGRMSPMVTGDCGLPSDSTAFLPQRVVFTNHEIRALRSVDDVLGIAWYVPAVYTTTFTSTTSSTPFTTTTLSSSGGTSTANCLARYGTYEYTFIGSSVEPAGPLTVVVPPVP